ncbi:Uncharacterized protein Adt_49071 [Abeliophyllum distichum]|uniref:Uncharacterized protein n=1 Tax=Abeliophyllum distichum TaxID=126358 RepID=A0ABD1NR39_9LAMI
MHDSRTEFPKAHVHISNPTAVSYTRDSFGHRRIVNFDDKVRKTAQNYENYRNWSGDQGIQFRTHQSMEEEEDGDSGVYSPPLWKNVPPKSPPNQPLLHHNRVQDIARGQWELKEMIKNLPESSYELSLKDLVEQTMPKTQDQDQEERSDKLIRRNHDDQVLDQRVKVKRQESREKEKRAKMIRNGSVDNKGLFLKMVFPISFSSKKEKLPNNASSKVSPKPEASSKRVHEWWKKRFTVSSNSDGSKKSNPNGSTGSSSSGGSYSNRRRNGFLSSRWSCFHSSESKSAE